MEPLTPGYHLGRLRGELERHPSLRGKALPTLQGDEFAVWLERDGIVLARVEERGRRRWWGGGSIATMRLLADELVRMMERDAPVTQAEIVSDLMRAITGI
jgi:hypothetical protein